MEFSRRGPATGGAGRFPDPPPHGERDPMLVMRDALLSQLHMARLRQEIIEVELAKIERAMALRATTGGHQTQITAMPMPWHSEATFDAGRSQPWLFSAEQPMADQNPEFDERKLPDSNKDALLSQLHMARLRQEIIETEVAQIENAMALCVTTGGHQTLTTPMPMPWHGVATADARRSKAGPFSAEQPVAQQNAEFDEHKLPDSNKVVPPSKASPAEKWELTGITIPVMELKPPMKWNCTVCQVQATSEQNLQQHYAGQMHLSNVATLDPTTKASDQKAKAAAEPSLGTEEKKTPSIKWSCSTCQANGTSQSTFQAHLKGKRHQQNIAVTSVEGGKNGTPKNVAAQEAKSHGINVSKNPENPPSAWSCSICQVTCTCQTDLKNHLRGISHREKVQCLLEQSKNKAMDSESRKPKLIPDSRWICNICHAHCTCQSDLENHLAGNRHQLNIQVQREKSNPLQFAKNQEPPSGWNCTMCEVRCNSKSQFEHHCRSNRHQQKIQEILGKGKVVKGSSSRTANELPSDGSNGKNASSEMAEKQPALYFCEVCSLLFESSTMLVHHRFGKKHRAKLSATNESS